MKIKSNIFFNKEIFLIFFLFLFSLLINQYYGNRGVFPPDSFGHFDTGFKILLGEFPFKDYWLVSGVVGDYLQAIFFYLFGVNWQIYVLHASLFNALLAIATFSILRNFKLNIYYSFFYSLLFSMLAYPSSGTPFVDHHAAFFSLLGIYCLILGIKNEKRIYWILLPLFLGLSFFSKIVPSTYIIIFVLLILSFFSIMQKKFYWIKYSLLSFISFILFLFIFGVLQGISLSSFLEKYIFFTQTIGQDRFENLNFTFRGVVDHYKFIYIAFLPLLYVNLKKIFFDRNYFKQKDFFYFLSLLLFTFSLIFHQLITKNQTFIFFLIPILFAFSHISLNLFRLNLTHPIYIMLIIFCFFVTIKYHLRFNEDRKFHELNYVDFNLSLKGEKIDKTLSGLNWISPQFENNPKKEINLINEAISHLKNDSKKKMIMTHYLFLSAVLDQKIFTPSRWILDDGTTHPLKGNKYFYNYKKFLLNVIKKNKIKVIYVIEPVTKSHIYDYIEKSCYQEKKITEILTSYELVNCSEINN